jgi:hypothetical protein
VNYTKTAKSAAWHDLYLFCTVLMKSGSVQFTVLDHQLQATIGTPLIVPA